MRVYTDRTGGANSTAAQGKGADDCAARLKVSRLLGHSSLEVTYPCTPEGFNADMK